MNRETKNPVINTGRLTRIAMLSACCAVLGNFALDMGNIKITFESIPVLIGALMFGPVDGGLIAGIGTLVSQLLRYGLTATTALWMIPYIVCGIIVGIVAKYKNFTPRYTWIIPTVILNELLITLLNTVSLYIDSKIYAYYSFAFIFGSFGIRIVICIIKSTIYAVALVPLIKALHRYTNRA